MIYDQRQVETDAGSSPATLTMSRDIELGGIPLRKYQLGLMEPATRGLNYIVNAPTGSGKTHVAGGIIKDHLERFG